MRFKLLSTPFLFSATLQWLASSGLFAATLAEFNFETDVHPTTVAANVKVSVFGAGAGIPQAYHSSSNQCVYLGCNDTGLNDLPNAIIANDYMTFTVTPDAGYMMNLTSLTLKAGYSNSRANTKKVLVQSVLSNIDGFTDADLLGQIATDGSSALDSSGDLVYEDLVIDLSALSQFQNITSATEFRIYIHDDTNFGINHRIDDLVLSGAIDLIPVPNAPVPPRIRLRLQQRQRVPIAVVSRGPHTTRTVTPLASASWMVRRLESRQMVRSDRQSMPIRE